MPHEKNTTGRGRKLFENGLEYKNSTPAELRDMLIAEQKQYIDIVRKTGAKNQ